MSSFAPSPAANARVGRDLLPVGRSVRVVAGLLLLVATVLSSLQFGGSPGVLGGIAVVFTVCVVGYTLVVWRFGERLFPAADPWLLAIALVAPALVLFLFPAQLAIGFDAFLGISMVVQAAIKYGGCEIMGIPTLFVHRRYTVYCAMNGGDVVEHWLAKQPAAVRWASTILAFTGVIVLMGAAGAIGPKGLLVGYLLFLVVGLVISRLIRLTGRSSAWSAT
ncbi:MAG: DUF6410 domain-containing protein [Chloroflexota bacterium]